MIPLRRIDFEIIHFGRTNHQPDNAADGDVPLAKWSCPDLAIEAAQRGIVESVSASTVRRWAKR